MTPGETNRPGHETRDVNLRGVTLFGALLAAVVLIVSGLMVLFFDYLVRREAKRQPVPTTLTARSSDQLPPEPRLQESPARDLAQVRAEEDAVIGSYGWVDRKAGVVRIPVEKAMEIVVEKGLQ